MGFRCENLLLQASLLIGFAASAAVVQQVDPAGAILPGASDAEAVVRPSPKFIRRVGGEDRERTQHRAVSPPPFAEITPAALIEQDGAAVNEQKFSHRLKPRQPGMDAEALKALAAEADGSEGAPEGPAGKEGVRRESRQDSSWREALAAETSPEAVVAAEPVALPRRRSSGPRDPIHIVAALRRAGLSLVQISSGAVAWATGQPVSGPAAEGVSGSSRRDEDAEWRSLVEGGIAKSMPMPATAEETLRNRVHGNYLMAMIVSVVVVQLTIFFAVGWVLSAARLTQQADGGSASGSEAEVGGEGDHNVAAAVESELYGVQRWLCCAWPSLAANHWPGYSSPLQRLLCFLGAQLSPDEKGEPSPEVTGTQKRDLLNQRLQEEHRGMPSQGHHVDAGLLSEAETMTGSETCDLGAICTPSEAESVAKTLSGRSRPF